MVDCFSSCSILWILAILAVTYYIVRWFLWQLTIGDYDKKYVLITGCDTGFGNLLAKQLSSMGFNVFAGCLSKKGISDLHENGSTNLRPFLLDVTKKEDIKMSREFVEESLPKNTGLWALVNNAGILGPVGFPDVIRREHYEKVLAVNMYGTIEMTMAFLPLLRQARGRIVNVASICAMVSLPNCIPYSISKYAVEAFSDGLRYSLKTQDVSVHILEPGLHGTHILNEEVLREALSKDFHAAPQEVQDYYGEKSLETQSWFLLKFMKYLASPRLQNVIDAHIHAVSARLPKIRYLIGYDANFIFWPLYVMPAWLSDFFLIDRFCHPIGQQKKKAS